jgi:hypothetical protein
MALRDVLNAILRLRTSTPEADVWNALGSAPAPTWTAPTLLNSWVNFGGSQATAGYYKDAFNRVHLKGFIKDGTATISTPLFVLPAGYRPLENHIFAVRASDSTEALEESARVDVGSDGAGAWLTLAGISFLAEA